jgi:glycosyltransferase involved in cell wall biosynthesis
LTRPVTAPSWSPRDPGALAAAIDELAGDEHERERLGTAAAGEVGARFTRRRLLANVQALYDRLL